MFSELRIRLAFRTGVSLSQNLAKAVASLGARFERLRKHQKTIPQGLMPGRSASTHVRADAPTPGAKHIFGEL